MLHQQLIPLKFNIKRSIWRLSDAAHAGDPEFNAARDRVLDRDDYTCRACNFRSPPTKTGSSYQEVHHLDDNHRNNAFDNLATLCPLCHQVFHIGNAGLNNGGTIIWLPEISQSDLNHLARSVFVAIVAESEFSGSARSIYASLEARCLYIEEVFASGASDPAFFGQAFLESNQRELRPDLVNGLRLLPSPSRFADAINHWVSVGYQGMPPESWPGLIKAIEEPATADVD